MFSTFGVQYAGYIDMAHVGYGGIPANERWFPNERLIGSKLWALRVVKMMSMPSTASRTVVPRR